MSLLHYKNITLDKVLSDHERPRKTKIVCTIGPVSNSVDTLTSLFDAGLNICRLNFSHGTHDSHKQTIANINDAKKQRPENPVAILLDTKGPEIRTGMLKDPQNTFLTKDSEVEIVTDYEFKGDAKCFACSYPKLADTVSVGDRILAADGSLVMEVIKVRPEEKSIVVRMVNSGKLGERKNMNLPGNKVDIPTVTEKDANDLKSFAKLIDFVAVSFVQNGSDAHEVRKALIEGAGNTNGGRIKLIAKIENQEGLHNFDSILEEFDAVMVARGDLGMEIPMQKVFLAQKMLIRKCNIVGKPVITATQMLESMTKNPLPTRAESTDVANAVLDGTDCVMLSGETASGEHPLASVRILSEICAEAENVLNHEKLFQAIVNSNKHENLKKNTLKQLETMCSSTVKAQIDNQAKLIMILSDNPSAVRLVSKYRPSCPVLLLTTQDCLARQAKGLSWATQVFYVNEKDPLEEAEFINRAMDYAKREKWIIDSENVILLKRVVSGGSTHSGSGRFKHLMEVLTCGE